MKLSNTCNDQQDFFGDEKATEIIKVSQPVWSWRMGINLDLSAVPTISTDTSEKTTTYVILKCEIKSVKGTSYTLSTDYLLYSPDLYNLHTAAINCCTIIYIYIYKTEELWWEGTKIKYRGQYERKNSISGLERQETYVHVSNFYDEHWKS